MRIDDDIRLHSTFRERHVDGGEFLRANTLLTMSRGEFVTDDGRSRDSKLDVDLLELGVTGIGAEQADFFDIRRLVALVLVNAAATGHVVNVATQRITRLNLGPKSRKTVFADVHVPRGLRLDISAHTKMEGGLRCSRGTCRFLEIEYLGLVNGTITEASFVSRLVEDHGILHVISGVRDDGDHGIGTVREGIEAIFVMETWPHDRRLTRL